MPDAPLPASNRDLPPRIVVTGFMGAGKSTVGRLLAQQLNWKFLDLDDEIEARSGASISEIFARHGEPWFRELEHRTILRLLHPHAEASLANRPHLVLALGGGAIEDPRTRELLLNSDATRLVHLEASLETVLIRCQGTESLRPVFSNRTQLESRYRHRLPLYRQAHHSIVVDSLNPNQTVDAILAEIRNLA